jgi:hypothetical protein
MGKINWKIQFCWVQAHVGYPDERGHHRMLKESEKSVMGSELG